MSRLRMRVLREFLDIVLVKLYNESNVGLLPEILQVLIMLYSGRILIVIGQMSE